jgi:hypothetical protein
LALWIVECGEEDADFFEGEFAAGYAGPGEELGSESV